MNGGTDGEHRRARGQCAERGGPQQAMARTDCEMMNTTSSPSSSSTALKAVMPAIHAREVAQRLLASAS
jgi:hypothetical protein